MNFTQMHPAMMHKIGNHSGEFTCIFWIARISRVTPGFSHRRPLIGPGKIHDDQNSGAMHVLLREDSFDARKRNQAKSSCISWNSIAPSGEMSSMYSNGRPEGVWLTFFVQSIPIFEYIVTSTSSG